MSGEQGSGMDGYSTGNAFAGPVLKTDTIILAIGDLCSGRASVEDTFRLTRHGLREVTKSVPLTTLLYTIEGGG